MSELHRRLLRDLVALFIKRIRDEHAAIMAEAYLQDLGDDHCPVCLANRRREAWVG
jgi:hypothetical protein